MFSRFVIGLVLPLLLPTLTIWFSLDHKRNLSGIERCFSTPTLSLVKSSLNFETLTRKFFSAAVLARPFRTKVLFRARGYYDFELNKASERIAK